jgi:hypothetical protein
VSVMDERMKKILMEKPDLVSKFPSWMISPESLERMNKNKNLVILEIAGRDSFAALFKYMGSHDIDGILPTIAYTGTEFGDWHCLFDNIKYLQGRLLTTYISIYPPVLMGAPRLWAMLCGATTALSLSRYGFYSPCIGCHLYLHALRIPLALSLGKVPVITGERESHDGVIKINQLRIALEGYRELYNTFALPLEMPLQHISQNREIEKLLGIPWERGKRQLDCVLSGNYVDEDGNVSYSEKAIHRYLTEFAIPTVQKWLEEILND